MESKALLIVAAIAALYYFFKSSQSSGKLLLFVVAGAVGLMYLGNRSGGLVNAPPKKGKVAQKISINTLINRYDINTMYDTYCRGELRRKSTCQCFVKPLHDDIRSEFSKRQIERLIEDEPKILRQKVRESFVAQEGTIGRCLETNNSSIDQALGLMCGKNAR